MTTGRKSEERPVFNVFEPVRTFFWGCCLVAVCIPPVQHLFALYLSKCFFSGKLKGCRCYSALFFVLYLFVAVCWHFYRRFPSVWGKKLVVGPSQRKLFFFISESPIVVVTINQCNLKKKAYNQILISLFAVQVGWLDNK